MSRRKRLNITVALGPDGRFCAGDGIWAWGTGRTLRSALRDYADTVADFIKSTEGETGPGLGEQRARYLAILAPTDPQRPGAAEGSA
jgi:hypothetical protein